MHDNNKYMAASENKGRNPNIFRIWISLDRHPNFIDTRHYIYGDIVE